MNFMEQWFGVSLDGGSGSLEAATILAVLLVACFVIFRGKLPAAIFQRISQQRIN